MIKEFSLSFREAISRGLSESTAKSIPCRFLYDDIGTDLFNKITQLDEYYLSRAETEILSLQSGAIARKIEPPIGQVVEFGCGDSEKSALIVRHFADQGALTYIPVDISARAIDSLSKKLSADLPGLKIDPRIQNYFDFLSAPHLPQQESGRLFLFLGSNIGNYDPGVQLHLVQSIRKHMSTSDYALIGLDLKKDLNLLNLAYNDRAGVTARFNFNLLERVNRELGGTFNVNTFTYHNFYNPCIGAMQSFLVSNCEQNVWIEGLSKAVSFDALEPIHIENSFKFSIREIELLARSAGFEVVRSYLDQNNLFVESLWKAIESENEK